MPASPELEAEAEAEPEPTPASKKKKWVACEAFNETECSDNDDKCALCTTPAGDPLCFNPKIAAMLPPCECQQRSRLGCALWHGV